MLISNALLDLTRYDTPKRGIETYRLVFKLLQLNIMTQGPLVRILGSTNSREFLRIVLLECHTVTWHDVC